MKVKHLTTLTLSLFLSCTVVTPGFASDKWIKLNNQSSYTSDKWIKLINQSSYTIEGYNFTATFGPSTGHIEKGGTGQYTYKLLGKGYVINYIISAIKTNGWKHVSEISWNLGNVCLGSTFLVNDTEVVQVSGPRYPNCK